MLLSSVHGISFDECYPEACSPIVQRMERRLITSAHGPSILNVGTNPAEA